MNDGKQTKTAAQIRPSTVVKSRMYLAGLNQLSDGVTGPIQKSLSSNKYQQISDIAPNTPINTKR